MATTRHALNSWVHLNNFEQKKIRWDLSNYTGEEATKLATKLAKRLSLSIKCACLKISQKAYSSTLKTCAKLFDADFIDLSKICRTYSKFFIEIVEFIQEQIFNINNFGNFIKLMISIDWKLFIEKCMRNLSSEKSKLFIRQFDKLNVLRKWRCRWHYIVRIFIVNVCAYRREMEIIKQITIQLKDVLHPISNWA